jgi:hypothetical protein
MVASESMKTLGSKTYDDLLHSKSPLVRKMFRPPPPKEFAHFQEVSFFTMLACLPVYLTINKE